MISISISVFRKDMKHYFERTKKERVLVNTGPGPEDTFELLPSDRISDTSGQMLADSEFMNGLRESIAQAARGEVTELTPELRKELLGL